MNLLAADGAVAFACCHCRAVRTSTGRWSQGVTPPVARVSHGICPTCLGLYYPGVSPPAPPPLLRGETNGQPHTGAGLGARGCNQPPDEIAHTRTSPVKPRPHA